mmetsp:Transcript_53691/g.122579  ORF Transcript_53691/g.122579 Transcript_53691/m.122579 type:complete len:289 (+) Transcript_53691:593-1459(+)
MRHLLQPFREGPELVIVEPDFLEARHGNHVDRKGRQEVRGERERLNVHQLDDALRKVLELVVVDVEVPEREPSPQRRGQEGDLIVVNPQLFQVLQPSHLGRKLNESVAAEGGPAQRHHRTQRRRYLRQSIVGEIDDRENRIAHGPERVRKHHQLVSAQENRVRLKETANHVGHAREFVVRQVQHLDLCQCLQRRRKHLEKVVGEVEGVKLREPRQASRKRVEQVFAKVQKLQPPQHADGGGKSLHPISRNTEGYQRRETRNLGRDGLHGVIRQIKLRNVIQRDCVERE